MLDAMRGYLQAASGLSDLTRKRAQELAASLLAAGGASATGGAVATQVSSLAEELIAAAKANRGAIREMVRGEVEVAVARLGLVPASELAAAQRKITQLEATVAELARTRSSGAGNARTAATGRPKRAAVKRAAAAPTATKTAAKAASKKAPSKKAPSKKAGSKRAASEKATTQPLSDPAVSTTAASSPATDADRGAGASS